MIEIEILNDFHKDLDRKRDWRAHSFAPFESNLKTTKRAPGKRHPGEKECTGEETIRPQRLSETWGKNHHSNLRNVASFSKAIFYLEYFQLFYNLRNCYFVSNSSFFQLGLINISQKFNH